MCYRSARPAGSAARPNPQCNSIPVRRIGGDVRMLRLRPLIMAAAFAALLPGSASAAGDQRPTAPAGGHDVTKPWIMQQASDEVSTARVGPLQPRGQVAPLRTRAAAGAASVANPALKREVLGFARADSLNDPGVGFRTWNFGLLSDVAYFGIHVNPDGTLVNNDSGWQVWQSSVASDLINTAHASGVKVLLTLEFLASDANTTLSMCSALDNGQTTIDAAAAQLKGADGIDLDYEGVEVPCPDGVAIRTKLVQFVQKLRASNLGYLVIDTYAGSPEDGGGFFDIPSLAASVDALFVMAYSLESSNNNPCATCMMPTSPLAGPTYDWNVTRAANDYAPWASQVIMGLPYYGVAGCVAGPNPPANAPVLPRPNTHYAGVPYAVFRTLSSDPVVSQYQANRDAQDPLGQEMISTYFDADPSLNCYREAYWDDQASLTRKYDLVNQRNLRGTGMFTLDFGGGSPELWNALALEFGTAPSFQSLAGGFTSSPTVSSWAANRLDAFARGQDNAIWHAAWNGASWSGWESLGGGFTSAPAAVSWGPNRIDLFGRGADNALWHDAWTGTAWSGWQPLGGQLTEAPTVSSWGPNRLDVFARGTDNALWHTAWTGSAWSGWQGLGGLLSAAPGAVSWGLGRIDVFVRGTDAALYHRAWDGSTWTAWEALGGGMTASAPAPASTAANRLDVFIPGQDGALYHRTWNGSTWSGFAALGPPTLWHLGPAAVSQAGSGRVDVLAVGPDNAIWHVVS